MPISPKKYAVEAAENMSASYEKRRLDSREGMAIYEADLKRTWKKYRETSLIAYKKKLLADVDHADHANHVWFSATPCEDHEFFSSRKIKPFGVRLWQGEPIALVHDERHRIWNYYPVQRGTGVKMRGRMEGCFSCIGTPVPQEKIVICVDYESGASIHMATGLQVAVVFSINNIDPIVNLMKKFHDSEKIYLAMNSLSAEVADTHEQTEICRQKYGCHLRMPHEPNISWNDLHQRHGLEAVSAQLNWE